jgi:hypothetical protein
VKDLGRGGIKQAGHSGHSPEYNDYRRQNDVKTRVIGHLRIRADTNSSTMSHFWPRHVYIVGKAHDGEVAGLKTKVVET